MTQHQPISVACFNNDVANTTQPLLDYLAQTPINLTPHLDETVQAVIVIGQPAAKLWPKLEAFVNNGGSLFYIIDPTHSTSSLSAMFGAKPATPITRSEIRVLPTDPQIPICARMADAYYMTGIFQPIEVTSNTAETVFYADWRFTHQPVITRNVYAAGNAWLCTLHDFNNLDFQRIVYRILQAAGTQVEPKPLGVGLLGYAPSVGQLHGTGTAATPGLALRIACDLSEERLSAAREHFPDIITTKDSNDLINNPDIDIVIIATAPNSHAKLALQMLEAGKHVICEKPLALNTADVEAMINLANERGLHVSCHQNRRWDSDFLAIQNAVKAGWLGDIYQLETFIGGYGHPCGYWHSHDTVSGGTTFDWGAHYLDWMLALIPQKITGVICTRQNRAWYDITNADQERIQLRYKNGAEAEFTHSDLAFIPKPKWFMSGDQGTLIGRWKKVDAYEIDPVIYYEKHEIPPSELGADIELRRKTDVGIFSQELPEVTHRPFPFHANLADHLLLGEPITVPVEHSSRVVAILEAAKRSAENGGAIEAVDI